MHNHKLHNCYKAQAEEEQHHHLQGPEEALLQPLRPTPCTLSLGLTWFLVAPDPQHLFKISQQLHVMLWNAKSP